jgi:acetoin utilization deacetylase AcuC-like enzyme
MHELELFIQDLKIENLSKDRLETLHTDITNFDAQLRMELIPLEKEEAIFMNEQKAEKVNDDVTRHHTDVYVKRIWKATPQGQRQIELDQMLKITPKLLQSCKVKLYQIY